MAKYTFDQVKRNVAEIANRDSYTKDFIFNPCICQLLSP